MFSGGYRKEIWRFSLVFQKLKRKCKASRTLGKKFSGTVKKCQENLHMNLLKKSYAKATYNVLLQQSEIV